MIIYKLVKTYIKIGLFLFYKKIIVSGKENIPKNEPILFVANHQNAMMDPLIVATSTSEPMYFLARASAFKNKIAAKLLRIIHAIAIYRVRDGVDSKKLNESVFKECLALFNKNENILIFPEGSHSIKRQVRSLRAGFTRMTIDYLIANPTKNLKIIPVGLNYDNTLNYAKSVHVIFGKSINSRKLFDKNDLNKSKNNLITEVHKQLKNITIHIEDDNYEKEIALLTENDFLNYDKKLALKKSPNKNIFYYLMMINSALSFLVWKWLAPKIKNKEFVSTAKFSLGITVFPFFYFLQTLLVYKLFGGIYALIYILLCFVLVFVSTKTR